MSAPTGGDVVNNDISGAVLDAHLQWCRVRNLRPRTIEARVGELGRLQHFTETPLVDITAEQLSDWWGDMTNRVSPDARATSLSHVREFFRWAVRAGHLDDDPSVHLSRPRRRRRLPRPAPDEVVTRVLEDAPDRVRWWVTLAAYAGLRAGEIAALHRRDIDDGTIFVADGKGGHQRVIPIHPVVLAMLDDELPASGWLFPPIYGRPLGHVNAKLVSVVCSRWFHDNGCDVTLHQFRHWFGTTVYAVSLDLRVTQELMGHSSPTTTAGYAAHSPAAAVSAVAALPAAQV